MPIKIVFAMEIRNGQKNFPALASKVLGLPSNNMLAERPRNKFCAASDLSLTLASTVKFVGEAVSFLYN
jgi:hypothetical protein